MRDQERLRRWYELNSSTKTLDIRRHLCRWTSTLKFSTLVVRKQTR